MNPKLRYMVINKDKVIQSQYYAPKSRIYNHCRYRLFVLKYHFYMVFSPWAKSALLPILVKVLLEPSHTYSFILCIVYSCFHTIQIRVVATEIIWPAKPKLFTHRAFTEKFANSCPTHTLGLPNHTVVKYDLYTGKIHILSKNFKTGNRIPELY